MRIADCGLRIAELAKQTASPERDRELANRKLQIINLQSRLRKISGPFLNWSGNAERLSFDVPTLQLFVHERLSTKAILETLKGHKRDKQDDFLDARYGFQERPLADQLLRAYEYRDNWVNRLMLGDSLVVMNSILRYESLGGQVQMIYMDPPYGVKFGSNFQPFVRKRDVSHNDDADMTREPEMVQAYRDTWELGLHSYLTYLRDRLFLARELLAPSGSIFVQISACRNSFSMWRER
jgi:adenine-specific DNA-methyltransferase